MRMDMMASSSSKHKFSTLNSIDNPHLSSPNVEEEYNKTLHSKSFVDMCDKVHHQLHTNLSSSTSKGNINHDEHNHDNVNKIISNNYTTNNPSVHFILEPNQETMLALTSTNHDANKNNHHHPNLNHNHDHQTLLHDYFEITYQACMACTNLLATMSILRSHHNSIQYLLTKLSNTQQHECNCTVTTLETLASLIKLDNPIVQSQTLAQLHHIQSRYTILIHQLNLAHKKLIAKLKLIKVIKRTTGLVAVGAGIALVALALAVHTVVGVGLALVSSPMSVVNRSKRQSGLSSRMKELKRVGKQVDVASKGAYIMEKDFETMSRMVQRVQCEVDHEREIARMAMRFPTESWVVRRVAGEATGGVVVMEEQLEELEEQLCLCLSTINKARRMVAHEILFD